MMRPLLLVLALLALAITVGSHFVPRVTTVDVFGAQHLDSEQVMQVAGVRPGDPFLWINRWRVRGLEREPWIAQARVVRHWPDAITLSITERTPLVTNGTTTWAGDGTVLPGVASDVRQELVRLEGWGPSRLSEALELAVLLEGRGIEVISYSPEGFEVQFGDGSLFTPSVEALRAQWASFAQHRGKRLAVYPWGVSSTHD